MFPFYPPENIRKPNISFPLIHTRTCMYQGGGRREMLGLQENQKGNIGKKRVNTTLFTQELIQHPILFFTQDLIQHPIQELILHPIHS